MQTNKKAAQASTRTAKNHKSDKPDSTRIAPLFGWHELARKARASQQKKAWHCRKKGGRK